MKIRRPQPAFAACVIELQAGAAPSDIQLLPDGEFRATDGRPFDAPAWRLDAVVAHALLTRAALRKNDFLIDYEHQSLNADFNGQPAPAAGWFRTMEYRPGSGLWATNIQWVDRAKAMIAAGEYRYLSPVFRYLPDDGAVLEILSAALTNNPALDGMADLAQRAAARFSFHDLQQEDTTMLEALRKLLGLADTAGENDVTVSITALKTKADQADTEIAALKSQSPDPAKYVPVKVVSDLQGEVTALRAKVNGDEVDGLITAALNDGRLLPAMEEWARNLGKSDIASLKGYLANAPTIAALNGKQTNGKGPGDENQGQLDDTALAVCKQLGVAPEDYKKTAAAEAA